MSERSQGRQSILANRGWRGQITAHRSDLMTDRDERRGKDRLATAGELGFAPYSASSASSPPILGTKPSPRSRGSTCAPRPTAGRRRRCAHWKWTRGGKPFRRWARCPVAVRFSLAERRRKSKLAAR